MEILLKSIIAGAVIGLVLVVIKYFGAKAGGILSMIPLMFTLSFIMSTYGEKTEHIQNFIVGAGIGLFSFLIFLISLYFLNKNPQNNYWVNLIISYVVWFVGTFTWMYFKK